MSYAIQQAKESQFINRIVVSTEAKSIAAVAIRYGAEIPCLRPSALATDSSKATDAVLHMLRYLREQENYEPDYLILLQATSPFRRVDDIDGAFKLLLKKKAVADSVVSVCRTEQLLYTKNKGDKLQLVSWEDFLASSNRQQLPPTYKLDGSMVYAIKTSVFLAEKTFLSARLLGYEIPRWRAVDLDESEDFVVGELLYRNRNLIDRKIRNFK